MKNKIYGTSRRTSTTLFPLDMDNSRLPIDVCEVIIDNLREEDWTDRKSVQTLLASALTCSGWLPRSRVILYCRVQFRTAEQVKRFVRTINARPSLAELVQILDISIHKAYLPLPRPYLLKRLCKFRGLNVQFGYIGEQRPNCPIAYNWQYHIAGFAITELELGGYPPSWPDLFRPIWSLRTIRSLSLRVLDLKDLTEQSLSTLNALQRPWSCQHLTKLHIDNGCLQLQKFPPSRAFGNNVGVLSLQFPWDVPGSYQNLLDNIALFDSLQEIEFRRGWVSKPEHCRKARAWVCDILSAVQNPRTLCKIRLSFWRLQMRRHKFLDVFWTSELHQAMKHFDNLQLIAAEVPEKGDDKVVVWWTERIAKRMPTQVHILKVTLNIGSANWRSEEETSLKKRATIIPY